MKRIVMAAGQRCFPACLAMVTGIPYETIPDFCARPDTWLQDARAWLAPLGWDILFIYRKAVRMQLVDIGHLLHLGTCIISGKTQTGTMHSVVSHAGEILDPSATGTGIRDWEDVMILVRITPPS